MCVIPPEGEAEAGVKAELGAEPGLVEEDLVAVSYMGDELDLKTVGDIIAIIEEKVMTFTRDTRGGTCHQRLCCGSFVTSGQPR